MSIGWRWFTRRPAPPGARLPVARSDRPPHGWEPVDPSLAERVSTGLDGALLRMTDAAVRGTSRRQFLTRTGAVGLALGAGAGTVLFRPERARAHGRACEGQSACGPSPLCSGTYCRTDRSQLCRFERADTARRPYESGHCAVTSANCWLEHCCAQTYNGHARCCDCCAPSGTTGCTGSGCPGNRCICRRREEPSPC